MIRPLIIGPEQVAQAKTIVVHSVIKEHWYRPGRSKIPGTMPEHRCVIPMGFQCVFSYTLLSGQRLYRHLSVSVLDVSPNTFPGPLQVGEIATLFGFTGWDLQDNHWPTDWDADMSLLEQAIVVCQRINEPS